ncbi:hypothetical protein GCM10027160_28620 [Streptomyces calidiresistens]|uniref:Integrase n=1 Tax=Streptomyces calidiresistens TaxID=1485586 RepID=A0A7W3T4S1_9ACTN|nr:hypothetical protein [Streptomyces calidiresistens]MBB0230758.1 hypothetical protein [Streptomyces calidiresistens]
MIVELSPLPTPLPHRDEVNARIRLLMEQPAGVERTREYARLLTLWAAAGRPELVTAA